MLSTRTQEQNQRLLELATHLESGKRMLVWRFTVYHQPEIPGLQKACGCAIGEWVMNPILSKPSSDGYLELKLLRARDLLDQRELVNLACEWFGLSDREYRCCFTSCGSSDEARGGAWLSWQATPQDVAAVLRWVAAGKPELFRGPGEIFTLREIAEQPSSVPLNVRQNINRLSG